MEEQEVDRKQKYRHVHSGKSALGCIHEMDQIQKRKEDLEDQLKEVNAEFDVLRLELIPTKMEEAGMESVKVEGVGRISLTGDAYVSLTDKEGFFDWLQTNNLQNLITETVNPSTLKAFAKKRIKDGLEIPAAVKFTPFTRAAITRS